MKKLYVLTANNYDGSYSIKSTFDQELINDMEEAYSSRNGTFDYEQFADGDGFNYETWNVPEECTPESMGFRPLERKYAFIR